MKITKNFTKKTGYGYLKVDSRYYTPYELHTDRNIKTNKDDCKKLMLKVENLKEITIEYNEDYDIFNTVGITKDNKKYYIDINS